MITIKLDLNIGGVDWIRDVFRSISSHASSKDTYEVLRDGLLLEQTQEFEDRINFVINTSDDSKITIEIPSDVLVLGYHWDKYIQYDLDNNKLIDCYEVNKRLGIFMRRNGDYRSEVRAQLVS